MFPEYVRHCSDASTSSIVVRRTVGPRYTCQDATGLKWSGLVARLEHVLAEHLLAGYPHALHLHAGGVDLGGVGVLLLGPSGSGKSTVAVRCLLDGAPVLGDDVVVVGADGRAGPFCRRPKIDSNQATRFGIDPAETVLWEDGAAECWLDPTVWAGWSQSVRVGVVARVRYVPGAAIRVEALAPADVLSELIASVFESGLGANDSSAAMGQRTLFQLAESCTGLRINYGDAQDAVEAVGNICLREADAPGRSGA